MSFSETHTFGDRGGCAVSVVGSAIATAVVTAVFLATEGIGIAAMGFVVALLVSMTVIGLAVLVIGLPLARLLESSGWERPWSYPLAGFVLGGAIIFIGAEAIEAPMRWSEQCTPFLLVGALPGLVCGSLWWWFERRHAEHREPGDPPGRER
ncbi:MAG TPA: hypothetical protein VIT45_10370 [Allosphingosinicella sp.]